MIYSRKTSAANLVRIVDSAKIIIDFLGLIMNKIFSFIKENPILLLVIMMLLLASSVVYLTVSSGGVNAGGNINNQGGEINNNSNNGGNQVTDSSSIFGDAKTIVNTFSDDKKNTMDDLYIEGDLYFAKRCKPTPQKGDKYNKEVVISLSQYPSVSYKTKDGHFRLAAQNIIYSDQVVILADGQNVFPSEVAFRMPNVDIIVGCK